MFRRWHRPQGVITVGQTDPEKRCEVRLADTLRLLHIMTPSCPPNTVYLRGTPLRNSFLTILLFLETSVISSAVFWGSLYLLHTRNLSFSFFFLSSILSLHLIFFPAHALSPSPAFSLPLLLLSLQLLLYTDPRMIVCDCRYNFLSPLKDPPLLPNPTTSCPSRK